MKLSTKPRYGIRILTEIALAARRGEQSVSGKFIAETQHIAEGYLEQIMIPLKRAGLVGTIRGCNGGYTLLKAETDISVLNVIELFEGRVSLSDCSTKCKRSEWASKCPTKKVWERLACSFRKEADAIKLKEIVDDYEKTAEPITTKEK